MGSTTLCAIGSAEERRLHTAEVTGSNPVSRTIFGSCHLSAHRNPYTRYPYQGHSENVPSYLELMELRVK